jgi:xanthine dehydrogenase accessory factor
VSIAAELIAAIRGGSLVRTAAPVDGGLREAVDPVCGMTVPIGPATEHLELSGVDYWFCCPGCRTSFAAGKAGV